MSTQTLSALEEVSWSVLRKGYIEGPVTVMIWKMCVKRKSRAG